MADSQIERLIELVDKAKEEYANDITDHTETDYIVEYLLNNGVIAPPCKVGDTMYFIERHPERLGGTKINTAEVLSIKANISHKDMTFWLFITYQDINGTDTCGEVLYGRTAFKTKEEAERELKNRGDNNA